MCLSDNCPRWVFLSTFAPDNKKISSSYPRIGVLLHVKCSILDRVAQLVEHLTFNQAVLGSSPNAIIHARRINACYSRQLDGWPFTFMG